FGFPDGKSENTGEIERIEGFTSCCLCYQTFTFTSTTGTRNVPSHSCVKNLSNTKITTYTKTASSSPQIKRGIYSVYDNRLKNILQELVILRARYGEFNLNNTLRGADTISNHIYNLADECRIQLNEIIHEPLRSGAIYVSPDLWSDNHRKISYLGMIATFVDDKFGYYIVDLSCYSKKILEPFGFYDLTKISFMSDRGVNLIKAFEDYEVLNCFPHPLNNALMRAFFQTNISRPAKNLSTTAQTMVSLVLRRDKDDNYYSCSSTDKEEEIIKPTKRIKNKKTKRINH
ncbi:unnamed protein product, partial [Rotaria sordida]